MDEDRVNGRDVGQSDVSIQFLGHPTSAHDALMAILANHQPAPLSDLLFALSEMGFDIGEDEIVRDLDSVPAVKRLTVDHELAFELRFTDAT